MTDIEFLSMEKPNLLIGSKLCGTNASQLFNGALELGKTGKYSSANSLLILSIEECIKSFVLLAGFCNVSVPFKVGPIFSSHSAKHDLGIEIESVIRIVLGILDVINMEKARKWPAVFEGIINLLNLFSSFDSKENNNFDSHWWEGANKRKSAGFYVDFEKQNWVSPQSIILVEEYEKTILIAKPFIRALEVLRHLNNDDYKLFTEKDK